jgi:ABC-type multidrug transport system fused ATPase/permease subunit
MVSVNHIIGDVAFNRVTYQYEDGKKGVLQDINLHVQQGETVAFVGESGVGKSTAISLISGYYFPTQGEVLIDGIDTRKMNLKNTPLKHRGGAAGSSPV